MLFRSDTDVLQRSLNRLTARHQQHPSCETLRVSAVRLQEHSHAFLELLNNGQFDLAAQVSGKFETERDIINNQLAAMIADDLP